MIQKARPTARIFNYAGEFKKKLDPEAVKTDLKALMTDSQDWVAGRLGTLWRTDDSYGLEQRRNLPGFRRSRWQQHRVIIFLLH